MNNTIEQEKKEEIFEEALEKNDVKKVLDILNDSTFIIDEEYHYIGTLAWFGHLDLLLIFLKDKRFNKPDAINLAIRNASINGHTDVLIKLLEIETASPESCGNYAIIESDIQGCFESVKLLFENENVRNSLKIKNPKLYHKFNLDYIQTKIISKMKDF